MLSRPDFLIAGKGINDQYTTIYPGHDVRNIKSNRMPPRAVGESGPAALCSGGPPDWSGDYGPAHQGQFRCHHDDRTSDHTLRAMRYGRIRLALLDQNLLERDLGNEMNHWKSASPSGLVGSTAHCQSLDRLGELLAYNSLDIFPPLPNTMGDLTPEVLSHAGCVVLIHHPLNAIVIPVRGSELDHESLVTFAACIA